MDVMGCITKDISPRLRPQVSPASELPGEVCTPGVQWNVGEVAKIRTEWFLWTFRENSGMLANHKN